jgi:signal transduction histidine kinase
MSLNAKIAFLLIGLTVLTSAMIGSVGYVVLRDQLLQRALDDGRISVTEEIARLRLSLHGVREDALLLARSNAMRDYLAASAGAGQQAALRRLERTFTILATTERRYLRIRYVDMAGNERAAVNSRDGIPEVVPGDALENRSSEPFFAQITALSTGAVHVSRLNLDRQHGVIGVPHQPTIRFVTPVFDQQGQRRGGIVINVAGAPLLSGGSAGDGHLLLLDHAGYFLTHRDPAMTFGFDLNQAHNAWNLAPLLADHIAKEDHGAYIGQKCTRTERPCATVFRRFRFDARPDAYWTIAHQRELAAVLAPLTAQSRGFLLAVCGAATLAGACGYVGSQKITRPVKALARAAQRIEAGGSAVLAATRGKDEFAVMARAFNRMTATLQALIERDQAMLRQERDVRMQLARAAAELARSNHDLERFVYIASHDLKAPLSAIVQLADWVEDDLGPSLEDGVAEHLHLLRGRAQRLSALLNDLRDYLRATKPAEPVRPFDTHAVVADVIARLHPPPEVSVTVVGRLPMVDAPGGVIRRIFHELIENGIRHQDGAAGAVWISVLDVGEAYQFDIEDDGPGIPGRYHQRIFQVFQTLRPRDEVEGSGIGLAIVARLLEICGGQISVASAPPRPGTRFRFSWPKNLRYVEAD